ncbi:MAG TPA: hypothetical protein PK366_08680 [Fibrobacteraceae bacterium]|nr:hypothetical protein [Fibrobacteraceae bacterium]
MNKKLWILTISAFFSFMALVGCSADGVADISEDDSSYIKKVDE